jgi:hypothetical protein
MADIQRAEDYFRRSRDKNGDEKLLARGLLHIIKHLGLTEGRDFKRATQILDTAWKTSGTNSRRKTADAMFLVARELGNKKGKRVKAMTEKHQEIMDEIYAKREALADEIAAAEEEDED